MIVEYFVENFRSFRERQALSMVAAKIKGNESFTFESEGLKKEKMLKVAAVYGPNASGKTNLFKSLELFLTIILTSGANQVDEIVAPFMPFLLDDESKNSPTSFSMEFIVDGTRYVYSFSYFEDRIVSESLYYFPSRKAKIFERKEDCSVTYGKLRGERSVIQKGLLPNTLFLSRGANVGNELMVKLFRFFRDKIVFYANAQDYVLNKNCNTAKMIVEDEKEIYKKIVQKLLVAADLGVIDISVEKKELAGFTLPKEMPEDLKQIVKDDARYVAYAHHAVYCDEEKVGERKFDLRFDESAGTFKIFRMAATLVSVLLSGGTLIIDELDNSVHTLVSQFIVALFNENEFPVRSQLLLTTHDDAMLTSENFRRDQIWFTEKGKAGSTELFSLIEFGAKAVREKDSFDKWYLDGRYGAIPEIKPRVLSIIEDECVIEGTNG